MIVTGDIGYGPYLGSFSVDNLHPLVVVIPSDHTLKYIQLVHCARAATVNDSPDFCPFLGHDVSEDAALVASLVEGESPIR